MTINGVKMNFIYFLLLINIFQMCTCNNFEGCYNYNSNYEKLIRVTGKLSDNQIDYCIAYCHQQQFRFTAIKTNTECFCNNKLGNKLQNDNCDRICDSSKELTCGNFNSTFYSIYSTGFISRPGPPFMINIKNLTDTSVHLNWSAPASLTDILSYRITAYPKKTYSTHPLMKKEWEYSNNTLHTEIFSLHPGTEYNLTLRALSKTTPGLAAIVLFETQIGEPDHTPSIPSVIQRNPTTMIIRITPTLNNNGPITFYRIIVTKKDSQSIFLPELLKTYNEAKDDGLNYYITAEIPPEDITRDFTIGNGRNYGSYYNAPLHPDIDYDIHLGVISKKNNIFKACYTNNSYGVVILKIADTHSDDSNLILGLSIAIGIITMLLILGLIALYILRLRVVQMRQRLPDNQELALQGPMIELENSGYIPEDELFPINHYDNLKQQVWSIPRNLINIKSNTIIVDGKYGKIVHGDVQKDGNTEKLAVYTIFDKDLNPSNKRNMLMDLDILIKVGKHSNLITLIGTCETSENIHVIMEYYFENFKDFLLQSRMEHREKFTSLSESQAFDFVIGIANGMNKLSQIKIIHKHLCARNIIVAHKSVPKIAGFGLCEFNRNLNMLRWTSHEILRGKPASVKSDVWAYGCLLWETFSLGGTPYSGTNSSELQSCVTKGLRLPQLQFIGDGLFELMLDCWQLNLDERPIFMEIIELLETLKNNTAFIDLNFNSHPGFHFEPYIVEMEINNKIN